jgi:hypothetical protein
LPIHTLTEEYFIEGNFIYTQEGSIGRGVQTSEKGVIEQGTGICQRDTKKGAVLEKTA